MRVIAHRGASAYCPENTLAAFRRALVMGARAVELDVQRSRDGKLFVCHDLELKRVAGLARAAGDLTLAELERLDAGSWFDKRFASERVPSFESALDALWGRAELHVELKQPPEKPYPGIEEAVLEAVRRRGEPGRAVFSSFHHPTLRRLRALAPRARLGYLAGRTPMGEALREARALGCESVNLGLSHADAAWTRGAREAGLGVLVYTVNTEGEYRRMAALGVEGVFSNHPDLGVSMAVGGTS